MFLWNVLSILFMIAKIHATGNNLGDKIQDINFTKVSYPRDEYCNYIKPTMVLNNM